MQRNPFSVNLVLSWQARQAPRPHHDKSQIRTNKDDCQTLCKNKKILSADFVTLSQIMTWKHSRHNYIFYQDFISKTFCETLDINDEIINSPKPLSFVDFPLCAISWISFHHAYDASKMIVSPEGDINTITKYFRTNDIPLTLKDLLLDHPWREWSPIFFIIINRTNLSYKFTRISIAKHAT